jgi:predicted RNA-binding Zn ribbon-like protein
MRYSIFPATLKYRAEPVRHSLDESNDSPETHPCAVFAHLREVLEAVVKGRPSGRCRREAGLPRRGRGRHRCIDGWWILTTSISKD